MNYFTYVLFSKSGRKTYVGHAENINKRLQEHNNGRNVFSRKYKSWVVLHKETFNSLKEAIKRENYLKSAAGRRWMKKNLFNL